MVLKLLLKVKRHPTKWQQKEMARCHPKETLHWCWVNSVVFSNACSDSTYAGHHLLWPLLMAMLTKSRSQTEWASSEQTAITPLRQFSCVDSLTLRALIRTASGQKGDRYTITMTVWHEGWQKHEKKKDEKKEEIHYLVCAKATNDAFSYSATEL